MATRANPELRAALESYMRALNNKEASYARVMSGENR
jgi:hypothetical protein